MRTCGTKPAKGSRSRLWRKLWELLTMNSMQYFTAPVTPTHRWSEFHLRSLVIKGSLLAVSLSHIGRIVLWRQVFLLTRECSPENFHFYETQNRGLYMKYTFEFKSHTRQENCSVNRKEFGSQNDHMFFFWIIVRTFYRAKNHMLWICYAMNMLWNKNETKITNWVQCTK